MLTENLSLIGKRWPIISTHLEQTRPPASTTLVRNNGTETLVIDNIHLSSAYDRQAEATLQATLIPEHSATAWVYGIGLGDLPRQLLRRTHLKKLCVVILNPAVACASLTHIDHSDWLADPRVELLTGDEKNLGFPFAANPACLQLADNASARLRDLVFLELATPYLNEKHAAHNPAIQQRIEANEYFVKTDGDVSQVFGLTKGATVMIAAAGPSLGTHMEKIRAHRDNYLLIAVNSALKPLALAGITPDVAVVIDDDEKIISCFHGYDLTPMKNVPLVYFPRAPEAVLAIWPGGRLTAYADHPNYKDIAAKYPRGKLFAAGSVLHPAVDLAVKMGAAEIILIGADLAYPGGQKYAPGAGWDDKEIPTSQHWVLNGHGQRVDTSAAFRGYLRDLEHYIEQTPQVRFFNSSKEGAHIKGTLDWE